MLVCWYYSWTGLWNGVPGTFTVICSTRMAAARLVSSSPGGRVGIRWWAGDVPRLLVTFSRACSIGLATVRVAGRPGGGAGGDPLGVESVDANGVASWRRCSMRCREFAQHCGREGFQSCQKLPHVHGRHFFVP